MPVEGASRPPFSVFLIAVSTCAAGVLFALSGCSSTLAPVVDRDAASAALFRQKCSACHDLERALYASKDEAAWRETVRRMRDKEGSSIGDEDVEQLVRFHENRLRQEQEVLSSRCVGCHPADRALEKLRTEEDTRALVRRMVSRGGDSASEEEVDLLVGFHMRSYDLVERTMRAACTQCHDLDRVLTLDTDDPGVRRMVSHMASRAGGRLSPDDVLRAVEFHRVREEISRERVFGENCSACHLSVHRAAVVDPRALTLEEISKDHGVTPGSDVLEIRIGYHRDARRIGSREP